MRSCKKVVYMKLSRMAAKMKRFKQTQSTTFFNFAFYFLLSLYVETWTFPGMSIVSVCANFLLIIALFGLVIKLLIIWHAS